MFAKSKIIRLALVGACLASAWLPIGGDLLQPAQANAGQVVIVRPIVRVGPVVPVVPIVRLNPVVPVTPIVRVAPVYAPPLTTGYSYWYRNTWYRWHR